MKRFSETDVNDTERLERLCRYLLASLDSDSTRLSYIGVALQKEHSLAWIRHIKLLLYHCGECMKRLRPEHHADSVSLALHLRTLLAFTSPAQWTVLRSRALAPLKPGMQQLCSNIMGGLVQRGFFQTLRTVLLRGTCRTQTVSLKPVSLAAIVQLATRPLVSAQFSGNLLSMFLVQVLSVPALVHHLQHLTPESLTTLQTLDVLPHALDLLAEEQSLKIIANSMQGTQSLALIANLVQLYHLDASAAAAMPTAKPTAADLDQKFTFVCTRLLQSIPNTVGQKGGGAGAVSQWHTLLGWFAPAPDAPQNENLVLIKSQIYLLWSNRVVHQLLGKRLKALAVGYEKIEFLNAPAGSTNVFKRALERSTAAVASSMSGSSATRNGSGAMAAVGSTESSKQSTGSWRKLGNEDVTLVSLVCSMYQAALSTLSQLKLDILSGQLANSVSPQLQLIHISYVAFPKGLCYHGTVLHDLFLLIASLGPNCGLKPLLEMLQMSPKSYAPPLQMLRLFCNLMTHYVMWVL